MKRLLQALAGRGLARRRCRPPPRTRCLRSPSIPPPIALHASRRHLSRRSRRAWRPIRRAISSSTRAPAIRPSRIGTARPSRMAARGCSSSIATASSSARSARILWLHGRPAGPRRSAGQHLGGRSDDQHGHQVRSARAGSRCCSAAKPEAVPVPARPPAAPAGRPGRRRRGARPTCSTARPTSPGTRPATSSSPTASATRASPSSTRTACSSSPGARREPSPASSPPPARIAVDAQGNVYVGRRRQQAHPGFRQRRQLQDADHQRRERRRRFASRPGRTRSSTVSNSNPPNDIDGDGEIYKMQAGRNDDRQVRQGRQAAEGVRHGQRHRLPQRERRSMSARSAICGCRSSRCTDSALH